MGRDAVAAAVTGQERDLVLAEAAAQDLVGGRAERRVDADPARVGEPVEMVEAAASDDAENELLRVVDCGAPVMVPGLVTVSFRVPMLPEPVRNQSFLMRW